MSKKLRLLVLTLLTLTIASVAFAGQYSSAFPDFLADHSSDQMVTAIITMADQVDLRALQDELYAQHADRRAWHEAVVRALQAKATETQADLLSTLADLAQSGQVEKYTSLWVGNIVTVTATPAVFDQLVTRDDILQISPDYYIEEIEPVSRGGDTPSVTGHEIGADRLHVPEVWAMGITGEGRLVSHLDTGVDGNHPALASRWRGVADARYAGHPDWAWFDPVTNTNFPFDSGQHGTHTMGTICGRSTTTADTVGQAIDAEWISAGVIDRVSIQRTVQDALAAFQWIVDPDGDPSTVWDVPDVNSNSWGVMTSHGYPPCDETFWVALDGCEAAGIVVVFAAGNEGPGSESLRRPADRATTDLTSFSVGAVDGNNPNLPIADFSSRGPSHCTPDGSATFKPEVVAPGVNVRSSVPGGGYQSGWSGTSMATPHIAGIVALMRQANPNLTSEQVRQILLDTADDLGSQGEDNTYGKGIANAYAAVQRALAYLQGWGTLGGVITDQATGNPIQGARITVQDRPWSSTSRADGQYYLFMPADTAWNIRIEFPPTHLPQTDVVTVAENDTLIRNYALEGKVPVILTASFGNPDNVDYRSFYLKGSWDSDGFYDASWSGPQIEIKDDGQAPDQTAGDGVFTGRVLLARDMTNTYSWAIYTENYGGENSRLQDGANFQITSLTPPSVPDLSVDPCGVDHNWGFSAYGDNGLDLDLNQVDANHQYKWAAAESLTQDVTYNFVFRTMHCDAVVYGVGGVGGTTISYTPTASGPYDFIFDDRDDSYIIQLTGTEGPPTYPGAVSGLDHHVMLQWLPPGTVESQEMAYDDGTLVNGWLFYASTNLMANMFTPSSYPVVIDSVMIHVLTEGDQWWPWPDGTHQPIGISIFLDDGNGNPLPDPEWYGEATDEPGEWIRVDVPDIEVDGGNFWIAMNNIGTYPAQEGLGLDAVTDYPANKWEYLDGVWQVQDEYDGDQMIRAKVFGNARDGWMAYDDGTPAGLISASIPQAHNNSGAAAGTGSPNLGGVTSRMAYHPKISVPGPPIIMDTQVLAGYNIYRDTATGPFNRPDETKINNELITTTSYDDWDGMQGPYHRLANGVTYYYQLSAVYDIGNGQFVEVGPSDEVTATPANHAPSAPFDAAGSVNDRTVHMTWSWANGDSDVVTFTVYKRQLPGGSLVLVGTTSDSSYDVVIPAGEDGIYRITITASDDGTPPMESEPSRGFDTPIGHLPPTTLVAESDHESSVPLRWNRPGAYRLLDAPNPNPVSPVITRTDPPHQLDLSHKGETEPLNPPMLLGRGGPDAFGYEWVDSDEPDGPLYDWRDITDRGVQIGMNNDDQTLGPFDIGFDFEFYGNTFNQFYVCSNGWVSFTDGTDSYYTNQTLPNTISTPFNLLAPFWDDLYPPTGGEYWYYSDGNELVISFINVMHIGTGGPYTFQIVLRPSGSIYFEYQSLDMSLVNSCTIGIQNADGSDGLQVVYNQDYLHDEMAIRLATGPEGFAPVHYKLYRGTTTGFPTDPAHLLTGMIPGDQITYVDTSGLNNGTTYYYRISAVWEDSIESPPSNEASATPVMGARMVCDPLSFNVTGTQGQSISVPLNISNPGGLNLTYSIVTESGRRLLSIPRGNVKPADSTPDPPRIMDKEHQDGVVNPPMLLDRGGPDEFGYQWIDSNEPGGPAFGWAEITDRGMSLTMTDDDNQGPFDLGFNFSFYGQLFSSVNICSNGWISFTSTDIYYNNLAIPGNAYGYPMNLVAPFWDDMNPYNGGEIWYYSTGDSFIVSYINMPHFSIGGPYTYQVILTSNGAMTFNYMDMFDPLNSATIGIQNGDGTIGLQVAYDQDYIQSMMSIRIYAGWLSADPASGMVVPSGNTNVDIICDATFLDPGDYTGSLVVTGTDINHEVGEMTIPVTFHVQPVSVDEQTSNLPKEFSLSQNYPNPFNPSTQVNFALPVNAHVNLDIYNIMGQKVKTLVDSDMEAGYKSVTWNGTDANGRSVASGTYFYILRAGDKVFTKKMTMLK